MVVKHIGSIGLILDIIGVSILFFVVVELGEQVMRERGSDEELERLSKLKRKTFLHRLAFCLIFAGFILQLISNERNIN